jgi:hypothetical protein
MKRLMTSVGLTLLILVVSSPVFSGNAAVRPSACQGSWYPATSRALGKQIDGLLDRVPERKAGQKVVAMVSPHASYFYSGETAAWGYKYLEGLSFQRVIILGPSHYLAFKGLSIPDVGFYETPLGKIRVDQKACETLLEKTLFQSISRAHEREHAIEIQLPFLQRTLADFDLVPMVVGGLQEEDYEVVSRGLRALQDKDTLIIASSDFTHFGPRFGYVPFTDNLRENIARLDQGAIDLILERDWKGFLAYRQATGATICGFRPIGLLLKSLPANANGRLLRYTLSGDLTGDYTNSVSYASIIFTVADEEK